VHARQRLEDQSQLLRQSRHRGQVSAQFVKLLQIVVLLPRAH
jgi:hypothetical protein